MGLVAHLWQHTGMSCLRRSLPTFGASVRTVAALKLITFALLGSAASVAASSALAPGIAAPAPYRTDQIIVRAASGHDRSALQRLHDNLGSTVARHLGGDRRVEVVKLPPGLSVPDAIQRFARSGQIEFAEPDYLIRPLLTPNDFNYYNQDQWNLKNNGIYGGAAGADIMAEAGWDLQTDASSIIVAVVDSGVRYTHEDLAANMWVNPGESGLDAPGRDKRSNGVDDDGSGYIDDVHGMNALNGTGNPWDDWGHGTHVAGIVGAAGNNGVGVAGVAWRVKIMACKFITADARYSVSDAVTCLNYARAHGARIVTASWGGYNFNSIALRQAIEALRAAGIIVAAAAGNDNNNNDTFPLYPAGYDIDNVVAVASTTRTDDRAGYSNFGAASVHLGAPGSPVFSAWAGSDRDYRYHEGTSMAAPHVAGACALLWARFPKDTHQQILSRVDPLPTLAGLTKSGGRLNLAAALASGAPPPPPPPAPLAAPTGLTGSTGSASSVSLNWLDNSTDETGFEVERSLDGVTFASAATLGANTTSYTQMELVAATTYYFRVRSLRGSTRSTYSNVATVTTASAPAPPPAGSWQSIDIGAVAASGRSSESGSTGTIVGSGADIWDNSDEFHYRYQSWTGDGEIIAQVTSLTNTDAWAKAGLMFREALTPTSRHAFMAVTPNQGAVFQQRVTTAGASSSTAGAWGSASGKWIRLVRVGDTFTAFESGTGTNWSLVGSATLALPPTLYVGFALTSHRDGTLGTATFDHVVVSGGSTPPPTTVIAPPSGLTATAVSSSQIDLSWADNSTNETGFEVERSTDGVNFSRATTMAANVTRFSDLGRSAATTYTYRVRAIGAGVASSYSTAASATTGAIAPPSGTWSLTDIGSVGLSGSNEANGNIITVRGAGADIWENADAFRFVYRTLTGDCTVEARVESLTNTNAWAKAGVMIRESLAPDARNVYALVTPAGGVGAQARVATGGSTTFNSGPWGASAPYWVRLVRAGGRVAAYVSAIGTTWVLINTVDFATSAPVYVGFAVTSHDRTQLNTAVFADPFIQ